jgi:hypothetical protein
MAKLAQSHDRPMAGPKANVWPMMPDHRATLSQGAILASSLLLLFFLLLPL